MDSSSTKRRPLILFLTGVLCPLVLAALWIIKQDTADENVIPVRSGPVFESRLEMPVDLGRLRGVDIQALYEDAVFRLAEVAARRSSSRKEQARVLVRHVPGGSFELFGAEMMSESNGSAPPLFDRIPFAQIGLQPPEAARAAYPDVITLTDGAVSMTDASQATGIWLLAVLVDPPQRRIQIELGWIWTISHTYYLQYQVEEDGRLRFLGSAERGCARSPMDFVKIDEPAR